MFDNIEKPVINKPVKKKRKKQKLEALFSNSLKNTPQLLGHKLHNNPMAHQTTHCDFEVFNKQGSVFFIEAKEVQLNSKGYGSFPFSRLTQKNALLFYDNFSDYTYSYLLLMFRGNTMNNSRTYLIPIKSWVEFTERIVKKSANNSDVYFQFGDYFQVFYSNNSFDLSTLYK